MQRTPDSRVPASSATIVRDSERLETTRGAAGSRRTLAALQYARRLVYGPPHGTLRKYERVAQGSNGRQVPREK